MKLKGYARPFVLILMLVGSASGSAEFGNASLPRSPRRTGYDYLVFPQGSNVQLVYCMTIGTYAKPTGLFTMGVTAGLAYELPHRKSVPYRKPAEVYHRRSRKDLYHRIEIMLNTRGKDGRACVLKSLCRAGRRKREQETTKASFLEEILHSVFTFPAHEDEDEVELAEVVSEQRRRRRWRSAVYDGAYAAREDCDRLFPGCPRLFG